MDDTGHYFRLPPGVEDIAFISDVAVQVMRRMMSADCDDCSWEEVYALLGCDDSIVDIEVHPD